MTARLTGQPSQGSATRPLAAPGRALAAPGRAPSASPTTDREHATSPIAPMAIAVHSVGPDPTDHTRASQLLVSEEEQAAPIRSLAPTPIRLDQMLLACKGGERC